MILYHWTQKGNIDSIMRQGLKTSSFGILYLSPIRTYNCGDTLLAVEIKDEKLTSFDNCQDWEVLCWDAVPPEQIHILWVD